MATYYLKSASLSPTAPYDTEETAATSMWDIRSLPGFVATDTIILCDDVTESSFDGLTNGPYLDKLCNIEAKAGLLTKPKYHYNVLVGPHSPLAQATSLYL